jgi:hypothetical protein
MRGEFFEPLMKMALVIEVRGAAFFFTAQNEIVFADSKASLSAKCA